MVYINGEERDVAGLTVLEFLMQSGYTPSRLAMELNGDILPSSQFAIYRFKDGDRVELVHFVGGG